MKVLIASPEWGLIGGSYYVGYEIAKVLMRDHHQTFLTGMHAPSKEDLARMYGSELKNLNILAPPINITKSIYSRIVFPLFLHKVIVKVKPDILWMDTDLYRRGLAESCKIVEYIHALSEAIVEKGQPKYAQGFWRLYRKLYLHLYRLSVRKNPFEEADKVLVNSKYTASMVKYVWGESPEVLFPPVDTAYFASRDEEERLGVIVTCRIDPSWQLEDVIVACSVLKLPLKIIGGMSDMDYYWKLKKLASQLGVKVEWAINLSHALVREELCRARVFVNTCRNHTFGLTVVEAMASGLPAIVHRSGAPYFEIVKHDKYGLSYSNLKELTANLEFLLSNPKEWRNYSDLSKQRAKLYNGRSFEKGVLEVIRSFD